MTSEPRIAPQASVLDHLNVRLRSHHLDQSLAAGTPPEAAAPLALRARRLTALPRRRVIAAGLRRAVRETCRAVPRDELTRLADALTDPGPVAARGAAEAWILLTDGTGPLYNENSKASLRARAASAANDLRLMD